ncbi:CPBP family intramembrane glutamic endopeptidase [Devosia ginsengisoli]|uniref:CPBP family intramembrane glutamic endopeptidase n=1 Tax=Devosia ginsengisoli TaxID=400770 RepID=UPI0026EDA9B8|nr:CPBP family intramembrane glutamic endopeptidase [Devosia ginsengisoli]MCR6672450.1 CPBP family intramembrane metalloprotease [Devosia ginsengisoli]
MGTTIDYPYYNGSPVEIGPLGWLAIVAAVGVAFTLLITLPFATFPLSLITPIVYTGLPLLTLALVSGGHQNALFRRFGLKEFGLAIGFGLLTLAASFAVGLVLFQITDMSANPTAGVLAKIGGVDLVAFLVRTAIQLVGEELMTILPLLAILWLCVRHFGLSRRVGLVIAVILSTAWFAAVHLPTYNWNFIQCFGGIGTARLVLTAAFLLTRNLWVSAGAHVVNDWTEFFLPMLLGGLAGHVPIGTTG